MVRGTIYGDLRHTIVTPYVPDSRAGRPQIFSDYDSGLLGEAKPHFDVAVTGSRAILATALAPPSHGCPIRLPEGEHQREQGLSAPGGAPPEAA